MPSSVPAWISPRARSNYRLTPCPISPKSATGRSAKRSGDGNAVGVMGLKYMTPVLQSLDRKLLGEPFEVGLDQFNTQSRLLGKIGVTFLNHDGFTYES